MTGAELNAIVRANPDCFVARLVCGSEVRALLIPRKHAEKEIPSMPVLTPNMLHGATFRINVPK